MQYNSYSKKHYADPNDKSYIKFLGIQFDTHTNRNKHTELLSKNIYIFRNLVRVIFTQLGS